MEKAALVRIAISIRPIRGQNGPAWGRARESISTIERNRADSFPVFFCERVGKILKLALAHGSCHCSPLKPRCILASAEFLYPLFALPDRPISVGCQRNIERPPNGLQRFLTPVGCIIHRACVNG